MNTSNTCLLLMLLKDCNMLFSKKLCVIVFVLLSLPVDVLHASHSTPYRGTIFHNSHPMLASVFNLANNVRQLQTIQDIRTLSTRNGDSEAVMRTRQIADAHNGIQLPFDPAQLRRQNDIINVDIKEAHLIDASSDIITETTNHAQRHGKEITRSPKPIVTVQTDRGGVQDFISRQKGPISGLGNVGGPHPIDESSVGFAFAADMLCSLCQRQGDAACIAIHCSNEQHIGMTSGRTINNPSLQLEPTLVPILHDNFNFANQLDRHDLLQATTVAVNQGSQQSHTLDTDSRLDMTKGNQFSDVSGFSQGGNTAPIWSMSDGLIGTAVLPDIQDGNRVAPVRSISDSLSLRPDILSEKTLQLGNMNAKGDVSGVPLGDVALIDFRNVVNAQGPVVAIRHGDLQPVSSVANTGSQHSNAFAQPPLQQPTVVSMPVESIRFASPFAEQPLEIPTDILRQMINIDLQHFSPTPDIVLSRGFGSTQNENIGQILRNEATSEQTIANNINRVPQIPVANDVFADVKHENNGHGFVFPNGFMEGNNGINPSTVNTVTIPPTIPTSGNIFADVNTVQNFASAHTLVLNNRGSTDTIVIHAGNGPIVSDEINLLGTSGDIVIPESTVAQLETHNLGTRGNILFPDSTHIQTETHNTLPINPSNHQGMSTTENIESSINMFNSLMNADQLLQRVVNAQAPGQNMQNVPITGGQQGTNIMNQEASASVIGEGLASTTPLPTMSPRRREVLQNWSKHLLNRNNV